MHFNESYNKEKFKEFLTDFLPVNLNLSEKDLKIGANCKEIKSGVILGECKSLGLKVIQLVHEKERDPRVALANEAFKIMAENWAKRALVVFASKNSDNWRLSFMTISFDINERNKVVSNLSNPKRRSFFLGPDAKTATPNQFLIKKGKVKNFEDLESRFDVEVVTKEFFDNYKKLFVKLSEYLKNDKAFNAFAGNHQIKLEDFAKKLLGQIVFIYFLQKKGWLGAKKEQYIYEGDSNFLRSIFAKCELENNNFFNNWLEPLFYNAFNKEPERAGSFYREYFGCQIPFLNGGLFEPLNKYNWETSFLHIPNEMFSSSKRTGVLDIFDLYNFTIDENNPIDQEVSVDPEMLGKVFEKLLDTNKETGSFYTPREIVSYMVKQSLIEYLKIKTEISEKDIEELVNNHQISDPDLNKKDFESIEESLKEIKIIDPAVGSGAFPVGLLQEMTAIRSICQNKILNKPKSAYDIKKEILENNIYGVDIDHGAIDIARLRFWLSLVVDADPADVEPLPNLEFKLVAANTLIKLNGEVGIWDDKNLLIKMKDLREKYFRARSKNRKDQIQNVYKKLINISNNMLATERQKMILSYDPFSPSSVAQFFDPEFMFGVKMFDLVIGNPPYISAVTMKKDISLKEYFKKHFPLAVGAFDIYILFLYKGVKLLGDKGVYSWIIPNKFLISDYAKKTKKYLIENGLNFSVNVSAFNVFKNVGVYPIILIGSKYSKARFEELMLENYNDLEKRVFKCFEKIKKYKTFKDFGFKIQSGTTGFQAKSLKKYLALEKGENTIEFIVSGSVDRYFYKNKNVRYMGNIYSKAYIRKNDEVANSKWDFWEKKKIIIAGMTKKIEATYTENPVALGVGIYGISDTKTFDMRFVLSLLNSKYLTFYLKNNFKDKHLAGGYLAINKSTIEQLPFIGADNEAQAVLIDKVDKILEITSKENYNSKNPPIAQIELENEIDKMVYDLYGLTKEEIKVIEKQ